MVGLLLGTTLERTGEFAASGAVVLSGDGCRLGGGAGCAMRARGRLAMVVLGPALPGIGLSGVETPVVLVERGGRRLVRVEVMRREGSCGSMAMAPSF